MECNKNANVVSCPPCGENVGLPTKRGAYKVTSLMSPSIGPADHFLRKGGRKGFTLIELLVVVLIIGILAAVALPQYQIAVEKSRLTEAAVIVRTIAKANQLYRLNNGEYTSDLEDLDITIPGENTSYHQQNRQNTRWFQYAASDSLLPSIAMGKIRTGDYLINVFPDGTTCCFGSTTKGKKICSQINFGKLNASYVNTENETCYEL